jgi:large subunit ribosomal protein L24
VRKGDRVQVLAGEDKGREGIVRSVNRRTQRVTVESINVHRKHVRQSLRYQRGGVVEVELPIHVSNVRIVGRG